MQKEHNLPPTILKEIRRMLVLYAAAIIEALLLYLYKKGNFASTKFEYTNVYTLPKEYQSENAVIVIAKQVKKPKLEREIMLDFLLKFFEEKEFINPSLAEKITKVKNIRNTFHLSKSRKWMGCSNSMVELANSAIEETVIAIKQYTFVRPDKTA